MVVVGAGVYFFTFFYFFSVQRIVKSCVCFKIEKNEIHTLQEFLYVDRLKNCRLRSIPTMHEFHWMHTQAQTHKVWAKEELIKFIFLVQTDSRKISRFCTETEENSVAVFNRLTSLHGLNDRKSTIFFIVRTKTFVMCAFYFTLLWIFGLQFLHTQNKKNTWFTFL